MNHKNIISNKFDLNWSTTFSYTGVQRFLQETEESTLKIKNWAPRTFPECNIPERNNPKSRKW